MKLLIISHTPHYMKQDQIVGWGSTIREIDHLATLFEEVVHIAPLYLEPDPGSSLPYQAPNVRVHAVKSAGGNYFIAKLKILWLIPAYIGAMLSELRQADVVHVRCPAAISLVALFLLIFLRNPKYRWIKYAGNWQPDYEPLSYGLQRLIIRKNLTRSLATINGNWSNLPAFTKSFQNPSMSETELSIANQKAREKRIAFPIQLLFVGRLETAKGVDRIIHIAGSLRDRNIPFELNMIGDGPEKEKWIQELHDLNLIDQIHFRGWLTRIDLNTYYEKAHFILLPSLSEGWPKVLSEAMAYGVVVLASNVSSIPQILAQSGTGYAIDPQDTPTYVEKIIQMAIDPDQWKGLSQRAIEFACHFTYEHYLAHLREIMQNEWNLKL